MNFFSTPVTRRQFMKYSLRTLAALAADTILTPLSEVFASPYGEPDMRFPRQIVAGDNMHGRTIMWQSNKNGRDVHAVWREAGTSAEHRVEATADYFVDDGTALILHTSQITGLTPGKQYEYRIMEGKKASSWYPLKTDDGTRCKAIIASDSQCEDGYITWRRIALAASLRNHDADLFLLLGDLVDNGESSQHWDDWFTAMDGIQEHLPLAPLVGNHETYDLNWNFRWPYAYLNYFDVPGNGSSEFPRFYYSFDYGPVHFIMLSTVWHELNSFKTGIIQEQADWMRRDIKASTKPWNVVCMHRDIYNYDVRPPKFSDVGLRYMPLFDELGIDAVLDGHIHSYRRRDHIYDFKNSKRKGPIYINTGLSGDCRYYNLPQAPLDEVMASQPETDNYLTMEATRRTLSFTCYLPSGVDIDHIILHK